MYCINVRPQKHLKTHTQTMTFKKKYLLYFNTSISKILNETK